jgi:hypothetical protein
MTPTPETGTARIRWSDDLADARHFIGHVGTVAEPAFKLYGPIDGSDRWLLSIRLRSAVEFVYRDDPDELKADAERLLAEFVSSLGAIFPPEPAPDPDCPECGFGLPRHDKTCSQHRVSGEG